MSNAPTLAPTKNAAAVALARLAVVTGANDRTGDAIVVQFNPASLQLQLSNELKDTKNNERKQYIAKANAKLTMELPFDTTDTGADVTAITTVAGSFSVAASSAGETSSPASAARTARATSIVDIRQEHHRLLVECQQEDENRWDGTWGQGPTPAHRACRPQPHRSGIR